MRYHPNLRLTRSASPRFLGGVNSSGSLSMNLANALHSAAEKKSFTSRVKMQSNVQRTVYAYVDNKYLIFKDSPTFQVVFLGKFWESKIAGNQK